MPSSQTGQTRQDGLRQVSNAQPLGRGFLKVDQEMSMRDFYELWHNDQLPSHGFFL